MIDLRFAELPRFIVVGGEEVEVNTDFRVWLEFGWMLENEHRASLGIFRLADGSFDIPEGDWATPAVEFYRSENPTPRGSSSGTRAIDLVMDGDYIVAAFQQAYGIDLTDPSLAMHWHRFHALLVGLPKDTKMSEVMSYRTWQKSGKKHDDQMRELKEAWRLPEPGEDEERRKVLEWADSVFG